MQVVPLTRGLIALVDNCDIPLISPYKWAARQTFNTDYAVSTGTQRTIYMHRLIMGNPPSEVDHIDRNGLNNQRANLRLATRQQNAANSGPRRGQYKGVCCDRRYGTWYARIKINGVSRYLGTFTEPVDAARAYDQAAFDAWGDRAFLNFPRR